MPAKSKKQQQAAGMALAAKRGEISPSKLKGSAKQMYKSMTAKQLGEYAETKTKGLPTRVKNKKKIARKKKRKLPPKHAPAWGRKRQEPGQIGILPVPAPKLETKKKSSSMKKMIRKNL